MTATAGGRNIRRRLSSPLRLPFLNRASAATRPASRAQRLLIFGAGQSAHWHAQAALHDLGFAGVAACSPGPETREAFRRAFPQAEVRASPRELLEGAAREDVVLIATPPHLHAAGAIEALQAGHDVLCEKPLATNLTDALAMVTCAERVGRVLGCCSSRFSMRPLTRLVRQTIESGEIGRPVTVHWRMRRRRARAGIDYQPGSRWFLDPQQSGGGCLMDLGCYDFSVMLEVLQPVRARVETAALAVFERGSVEGVMADRRLENQVVAQLTLELASREKVTVAYERSDAGFAEEIERPTVEGRRGAITWDWMDWLGCSQSVTCEGPSADRVRKVSAADACRQHDRWRSLEEFCRHLDRVEPARDIGWEAYRIAVLTDAVYRAAAAGHPQEVELRADQLREMAVGSNGSAEAGGRA